MKIFKSQRTALQKRQKAAGRYIRRRCSRSSVQPEPAGSHGHDNKNTDKTGILNTAKVEASEPQESVTLLSTARIVIEKPADEEGTCSIRSMLDDDDDSTVESYSETSADDVTSLDEEMIAFTVDFFSTLGATFPLLLCGTDALTTRNCIAEEQEAWDKMVFDFLLV